MDRHRIVMKIAEMRGYIASNWPDVEERKSLYVAIREMEALLREDEDKQKETEET